MEHPACVRGFLLERTNMVELEKKLNYTFRNPALLEEALSHSSYANEHRAGHLNSNERLEFLGDSVLGFVTAEFLFLQHPGPARGRRPGFGRAGVRTGACMRWRGSWTWAAT